MNSVKKTSIVLGIAFLLEFITNAVNGLVLRPALITLHLVPFLKYLSITYVPFEFVIGIWFLAKGIKNPI